MNQPLSQQREVCAELSVNSEERAAPLSDCVSRALHDYFDHLDGMPPANLYEMLMTEVEVPLLKSTLSYTNGNQSRAAEVLGINRGTLRKKLKLYGL